MVLKYCTQDIEIKGDKHSHPKIPPSVRIELYFAELSETEGMTECVGTAQSIGRQGPEWKIGGAFFSIILGKSILHDLYLLL